MAIKLQDIADELEISVATVSRSLRHDPLIHPKTRAQVSEMALRLGYEGRARRPRHKVENGTLGLLLHAANITEAQRDPNIVRILQGIMAETDSVGMQLNLHPVRPGEERLMEEDAALVPPMIRDHLCQAVLVRGKFDPRDVAFMARQLPVVSLGRIYHEAPVDAVVGDDFDGIRALVVRLVELGHRRLTWVGAHYRATFLDARQAGFVQGCLGSGLDLSAQRYFGPEIYEERRVQVWDKLLHAVNTGATAMVCANDSIALQVIEALEKQGLRVPEDVSVTGFDAWHDTASDRHLASVDPQFFEIGRTAVRMAVQRMSQSPGPPCTVSVRGVLVPGETIAAPRHSAPEPSA